MHMRKGSAKHLHRGIRHAQGLAGARVFTHERKASRDCRAEWILSVPGALAVHCFNLSMALDRMHTRGRACHKEGRDEHIYICMLVGRVLDSCNTIAAQLCTFSLASATLASCRAALRAAAPASASNPMALKAAGRSAQCPLQVCSEKKPHIWHVVG